MPIYSFSLDVDVPPQIVAERLKSIVGKKPGFWGSLTWPSREAGAPPFIGTVQDDSFRIQRDIRYRNSFLPLIRGRVTPSGMGARVSVTMFIHPLVAVFMVFWLGVAGNFALTDPTSSTVALGMMAFGIALTVGAFFPEAVKARRLISEAVQHGSYREEVLSLS